MGYCVRSLFSAVLLASEMLEWYVIKTILAVGCIKCWQGRCPICIFLPQMFLFIKCFFLSQQEDLRLLVHSSGTNWVAFWLSGSAVGSCAPCWNCCFTSHHPTQCRVRMMFPLSLEMQNHLGKPEGISLVLLIEHSSFHQSYILLILLWEDLQVALYSILGGFKKQNYLQFVNWWNHVYARLWPSSRLNIYRPLSPSTPTM